MEDEDGEGKMVDMWNILEEQQRLKDTTLGNALRHSIDDVYTDVIEEEKKQQQQKLIRYNSIVASNDTRKNIVARPKLIFKGLKKRILAEAREGPTTPKGSIGTPGAATAHQQSTTRPNVPTRTGSRDGKGVERKRKRKITEYAQYLGLRPSSTRHAECSKCHARQSTQGCGPNSCACNPSGMTLMAGTSVESQMPPAPPPLHASNFKITRKVYLCSACGTYFENWNLFLHMRDIHERHICLYCLGMFGQAERLLCHLMNKHSVPEMAFTTVEDFYRAFKGSCYLICCSCEKVFSETDDFYNHFCVPVLGEQDAAAVATTSTCTICRQTDTHASTCSFALSLEKDSCALAAVADVATCTDTAASPATAAATVPPASEIAANLGGKGLPRKAIKYSRRKQRGRDDMQNSRQQKPPSALTRMLADTRSVQCNENQFDRYDLDARELTNNLPRDTVTETIMEVSRYTGGDSSDENDENDEQAVNKDSHGNRDRGVGGKSPAIQQNCQLEFSEPYDSVTETIMEVSRYTGEENKSQREENTATCIPNARNASHVIEKTREGDEACEKNDVDPSRSTSGSTAPSPVQWDAEAVTADTKANASAYETKYEASLQDARSCSPINRSLFSPQHESQHISDPPKSREREGLENVDSKRADKPLVATNASESQASVSFNAVTPSDRSLVIKICNRNSQFSVATTTVTSRESEENNNAEESTSKERLPNGSQTERRDVIGDDNQVNELDDSDSDSDKLAVVDSNPEEDEEAEEGEEGEEVDVTEDRHEDGAGDKKNQRNQEENNDTRLETYTDELFSVTGTPSIDNAVIEDVTNSEQTQRSNHTVDNSGIVLAGEDVPCIDLNVEGTLDSMELEELLKRCIQAASPICVYCNHARYIAVNGRQLGLHMLAEHKFQPQHPAIIIHAEQFTARVKRSLDELESRYFNLDTYNSADGTYNVPKVLIYECFHCRFHSTVHKELYLHNRKMHQKTILICIMCKSTFYSYSELVCHLCPGVYSPNANLRYRCCLCTVASLPSAFRLMVHVRKRHHACDVCLESTGNQQRLSNHVWKHKLHHLCYRCGIAYRNKPDITKHLFWKHGTESVLCRKCLQKKWPHIYHFCIPPTAFGCEECGLNFGRAVALKVHKRLHSGDSPYGCDECEQRFISRKLLAKHQATHQEPEPPEDVHVNVTGVVNPPLTDKDENKDKETPVTAVGTEGDSIVTGIETGSKNVKEAVKKVVDVYDLPPLNLSSESDTDSEEEKEKEKPFTSTEKPPEKENINENVAKKDEDESTIEKTTVADDDDVTASNNDVVDNEVERNEEEKKQEARIMDGIWDTFKTYAASLDAEESAKNVALKESVVPETDTTYLRSIVFSDHDYCVVYSTDKEKNEDQASKDDDTKEHKSGRSPSPGTPTRNTECDNDTSKRKTKTPKKKKRSGSTSSTSDSSSDSDSSSCSCGTNCSCSSSTSGSSSGSSSSSSDSDSSASESSPRKQQSNSRKDRNKKEKEAATRENKSQSIEPENKETEITIENGPTVPEVVVSEPSPVKPLLRESDLETEETETDEDFYDEYPQLLANKLLAEKRNQLLLLAAVAPASTPSSTPTSTPTSTLMPAMEQSSMMPLNNGILAPETALSDPISMAVNKRQSQQQQKRKTKTKKRRKGERGKRNAITTPTVESIKLNIPKAFYQKNPGFTVSSQPTLASRPNSRSSNESNLLPAATCNDFHAASIAIEMHQQQQASSATAAAIAVVGVQNQNVGGQPETENKRVSKRKRVPKRFYGDSSDDEPQEKQPFSRWRKIDTTTSMMTAAITNTTTTTIPAFTPVPPVTAMTPPNSKPLVSKLSFSGKAIVQTYGSRSTQAEQIASQQQMSLLPEALPIAAPASATESEDPVESSSESSESETENTAVEPPKINPINPINPTLPAVGASTSERPGKIYCYCQCPYDEVSEMIACDGDDCRIEWFHFECVGIMVPPKGKWYCPDCRKKHGIVQNDEYCD